MRHAASDLDAAGRWAISVTFEGVLTAARFATWTTAPDRAGRADRAADAWSGPGIGDWESSLERNDYCAAVEEIRSAIERGDVYQVNACRVMRAVLPDADRASVAGLDALLARHNPAPFGGFLELPDHGTAIACASPELFVSVRWVDGRRMIRSGPIKGTGRVAADLLDKDTAENIMIVDLVRNDLSRICRTGSVRVPELLQVEEHPGLVHLVSYVEGELVDGTTWEQILEATFPPGSVTGAPKHAALRMIGELESSPRGPYCGAFGWIDADSGEAELAVAIRTFWLADGFVCFGTGAGITWGSDPGREWEETELKAGRLIQAASMQWPTDIPGTPGFQVEEVG